MDDLVIGDVKLVDAGLLGATVHDKLVGVQIGFLNQLSINSLIAWLKKKQDQDREMFKDQKKRTE